MHQAILDALKNRRSIRSFTDEQVSREDLDTILLAGTYAPTAMGAQSPVIVSVQDAETLAQLRRMNAAVLGGATEDPYYGAPTIILVLGPDYCATRVEDASLALGNMMLAAYALDLGACWIHREQEMFATEEGKALLKKWHLSEDLEGVGALALGHISGDIPSPARRKEDYILRI